MGKYDQKEAEQEQKNKILHSLSGSFGLQVEYLVIHRVDKPAEEFPE